MHVEPEPYENYMKDKILEDLISIGEACDCSRD